MANNGGATKGYAPLGSFVKDIYSELEKPISTQNWDIVDQKIGKVLEEISRAQKGIETTLNSGGKVSEKAIEALGKESKIAADALTVVNDKLAQFEKFSNAKANFGNKFQELYKLRNGLSSIQTGAKLAKETADGTTAMKQRQREQAKADKEAEAKREQEERARAQESRKKLQEEQAKQEPIKKEESKKVPVDVGKEQSKGQPLSEDQVRNAIASLKSQIEALTLNHVKTGSYEDADKVQQLTEAKDNLEKWLKEQPQKGTKLETKPIETVAGKTKKEMLAEDRQKAVESGKYRPIQGQDSALISQEIDSLNAKIEEEKKKLQELQEQAKITGVALIKVFDANQGKYVDKPMPLMQDKIKDEKGKDKFVPSDDQKAIDEQINKIEELKSKKRALENLQSKLQGGQAPIGSTATDGGKALDGVAESTKSVQGEAGKTTSSLKNLDKELKQKKTDSDEASSGFARFGEVLKNTISTIGKVAQTIGKIGGTIWHGFTAGINAVISGVKTLASGLHSLVSGGFNLLKSAVSTTLGNMQKLVSGGFNAVKNGIGAVKKGFENVKNTMTSLVKKGTPNLMKSFGSLKSMLMRRIKRTFISSIFNQAKEGLQQLAKSSRDFDQSMSNIKNTSKQVAGNLAITLGNLIQTIEPVLTTLLGWLNKVFEAINGLFAMISGKKTMLVAKKNTDQYSKSLKNASGSAKDLNHQLYGFDEITRQEDNSSSGGGGKIGYESAEIGDRLGSISDFFKNMLIAFKNGQFEKVGSLVAEQLNNLVEKVDKVITDITPKAKQWATNIARILNGMLLSPKLFENLGKLLGDGINLAFGVVNNFLKTFDFKKLGSRIGLIIKKAFKTIKWRVVGEAIANYFNMLPRFLAGLFEELNWSEMGDKIATGIASFFRNIDWQARQDAISNGINGIVTFLTKVITGVNWANFATTLGNHIKDTVNAIHWSDISNLLSTGANKLFDAFGNLVDTHFFSDLFGNIGKMIGDALANINWGKLAQDIVLGLAELRNAFWSLINNIDLPNLATKLAGAINGLLTDPNVQAAWDESSTKATEGLKKIIDAFANLVKDPPDGIDFDGIASTIGTKVGNFLSQVNWEDLVVAIGTGATKLAGAFGTFVKDLHLTRVSKKIASGINQFFAQKGDDGQPILVSAAGKAGEGIQSVLDAFSTFLTDLDLQGIAGSIAQSIRTFFSKIDFQTVVGRIGDFVTDAMTQFNNLIVQLGEVDEHGDNLGQRIAKTFNSLFVDPETNEAKTDMFAGLGESLSNALKSILENAQGLLEGINTKAIAEDIKAFLSKIDWVDLIKKVFSLIGSVISSAIDALGDLSAMLIEYLKTVDWLSVALEIVKGIANVLWKAIEATGGFMGKIWKALFGDVDPALQTDLYTKETADALKARMGEAGYDMADALYDGIQDGLDEGQVTYRDGKVYADVGHMQQQYVEAAALIALGFQNELGNKLSYFENSDEIVAKFGEWTRDLVKACSPEEGSVQQIKDLFYNSGLTISDGLAEALMGKGADDIGMALMLLSKGVDEQTVAALASTNLNENLANFMNETGMNLEEVVKVLMGDSSADLKAMAEALGVDVGSDLGETVPKALKEALEEGKGWVKKASDEVSKEADVSTEKAGLEKKAEGLGSGVTNALAKTTEEGKKGVEDATTGVTGTVKDKYEALPDEVKPYAEQLMEYITTALMDKDGTVKAAIEAVAQGAIDRVKEILSGQAGLDIVTTFLNGVRDGLNKNTEVVSSATAIASNSLNNIKAYMGYSQGYRIGQDMITGLYNGFHSYSQKLVDFIAHVCNTCAQTARDILGIASPSKVFAQIGSYTMEGMQIGLESQSGNVVDTVAEVTNAITEAGEEASLENIMGDGLDNVATKLERIVDIFSDMADVIASMGGLEIPTVAAGKTIPYSTQMGGSTFGGNLANGGIDENAIENAFYSAITRAMDNSNGTQNINVYLDGRQIADSVTKYQRRNARAMGV